MLFNSTFRGVVANKDLNYHPAPSWLSVLQMECEKIEGFLTQVPELKLVEMTSSVAINIPITNPTYGEVSLPYDTSVTVEEEIKKVKETILQYIDSKPVIASVNSIDRFLTQNGKDKCEIYRAVDELVKDIILKVDDFIVFSPYGEPTEDGKREQYGVYLASVPRPHEHETVKLAEIGKLFLNMVK